jgi:hypothetical protein
MSFLRDAGRDLAELVRNPRQWWYRAGHTPCPVCAEHISVGHEWQVHKLRHGPVAWQAAIGREQS